MADIRVFSIAESPLETNIPEWRFIPPSQSELDEHNVPGHSHIACSHMPAEEAHAQEAESHVSFGIVPAGDVEGQHWTIGGGGASKFGTRRWALETLGIPEQTPNSIVKSVGVVVLDAGLNRDYLAQLPGSGQYGGGWTDVSNGSDGNPDNRSLVGKYSNPHKPAHAGHGNMLVRNILSVAPDVTIYDAPVLPPFVDNMQGFAEDVLLALTAIEMTIKNQSEDQSVPSHDAWILVNAWAVANSNGQKSLVNNRNHALLRKFHELVKSSRDDEEMPVIDVVFAAGNAGSFQPASFTGPYDRGHGRSIWGPNGLEEVLTVGAVRADEISIGASSQGPAPQELLKSEHSDGAINEKPDICAPSWFSEDNDPLIINTGTSAACGLIAGMLARLRQEGNMSKTDLLNLSGPPDWSPQRGMGIPKFDEVPTPPPAAIS